MLARPRPLAARRIAIGLTVGALLGLVAAPIADARSDYRLDLGRPADFVAQTNLVQCVGASMQMMLNMMSGRIDRTASTQLDLQRVARAWSGPRPDGHQRGGASVFGWATGLTLLGGGRYEVVGARSIDDALLIAAKAMRKTGRPAGLLM